MSKATDSGEGGVVALLLVFAGYFFASVVPCVNGNEWRVANLQRRGFREVSSVPAESGDAAIAVSARSAMNSTQS